MCFEIMKAEVLVYASGRRGTLDKSGIAGSAGHLSPSALPRLLGSGRGGPWRHRATGRIWLWLFPLWAPPHQRGSSKPQHLGLLSPSSQRLPGTHVSLNKVDFTRENSQPGTWVSQEAGVRMGSGFSHCWVRGSALGCVLSASRVAVTGHLYQSPGAAITRDHQLVV